MLRTIGMLGVLFAGCYGGVEAQLEVAQPRSLAGTEIDGELRSERGAFVFDEAARQAFDYFLTAEEELGGVELDAWVHAELIRRVPAVADEAMVAWHSYVVYRSSAAATLAEAGALELAERRMNSLVDEQLGEYPIAKRERAEISRAFALQRATALTGEAREVALAGLVDGAVNEDAFVVGRRAVELARLTKAGPGELQAVRTQYFGAAAAERLSALDARRSAWEGRLDAFHSERAELLAGFTGSAAQRDAAVAGLEATHFSEAELRRVHALARISRIADE